ncbi:MAG TPA: BTAD domain-containing putative transcriptional regulator [Trebonia sp.]|nr:BTAD domain-containing putative transcriptional regulator [Trebonia sp.]
MSELGDAIGRFRRLAGLTQAELADAAGLSVGFVRDLEQGRTRSPRWGSVETVARTLRLSPHERAHLDAAWDGGAGGQLPGGSRPGYARPAMAEPVAIRILGPVTAERRGHVIDLGPARRRAVLGLIALRGEAGARPGELTDLMWPGSAPATAAALVHRSVSQLRRLLACEPGPNHARAVITWTGASYRLEAGIGCRLDSADFAGFTQGGDRLLAAGVADRACSLYERALGLWRDGAVADLDCLRQHPVAVTLNRRRSEVVRRYARAAAQAGEPSRALEELYAACLAEPLSEELHTMLITALGGSGRKAEAAQAFGRLRDRLDDELGIRPSDQAWHAYGLAIGA